MVAHRLRGPCSQARGRSRSPWRRRAARRRCGGGTRQDAQRTGGHLRDELVHASFPVRQLIARRRMLVLAVRNTGCARCPTWPSPWTPSLRLQLPRTVRQQATRVGDRTGPRRDRRARPSRARRSASPAAARPPTSTPGRSARSLPARRTRSGGSSFRSSPDCTSCTSSSRPTSRERPRPARLGAPVHGRSPSPSRRSPQTPRQSEHGQGRTRALPEDPLVRTRG